MNTCFTHQKALVASTGEEAAYERLIQRFGHPVFNLVSRLMDDPSDAIELVLEVFRKAFRNIETFRSEGTLRIWIYRVAVKEVRNHRRWFRWFRWHQIGLTGEPGELYGYEDSLSDPEKPPFEASADQETESLIKEALSTMDPKLREVLVLREIEDLSYTEMSEILDVSLDTVKARTLRGREALRKHLADRLNPSAVLDCSTQLVD